MRPRNCEPTERSSSRPSRKNDWSLEYASESLRDDEHFVADICHVLNRSPEDFIEYTGDRLRATPKLVHAAMIAHIKGSTDASSAQ